MGRPAIRTEEGLLGSILRRLTLLERRRTLGGLPPRLNPMGQGTTAERNAYFGTPSTDAGRAALANLRPHWWNVETGTMQTYYAMSGTTGLTVPGLVGATFAAGWFNEEAWGGKAGPSSWVSAYKANWNKGVDSGGVIDAHSDGDQVLIGLPGIYECYAVQRGTSSADFIGISLNGDRTAFENRVDGVWTHDHAAGANHQSKSTYLGPILAGESVSAGSPTTGGGLTYSTAGIAGILTVKRIM